MAELTMIPETDRLIFIGGHSERLEVLNLAVAAIEAMGIFKHIDVATINMADDDDKTVKLIETAALEGRAIAGHSAATTRIKRGLQAYAFNPSEPLTLKQQWDGMNRTLGNPVVKEPGAHETDRRDMLLAGKEQALSPISTCRTIKRVRKSSGVELLANRLSFPAGVAIVHSEFDDFEQGFGFTDLATTDVNLARAQRARAVLRVVPDMYHNSLLFGPKGFLTAAGPTVFPQEALDRMNQAS